MSKSASRIKGERRNVQKGAVHALFRQDHSGEQREALMARRSNFNPIRLHMVTDCGTPGFVGLRVAACSILGKGSGYGTNYEDTALCDQGAT